ncbi:MAG: hypothetical protein U0V64_15570 [Cyclobacteriaceae bacterium]
MKQDDSSDQSWKDNLHNLTPIEIIDINRKVAEGLGNMIDKGKAMRDARKAKEELFRASLGIRLKTPKKPE